MKETRLENDNFRTCVDFAVYTFFLSQIYLHYNQILRLNGAFPSDFPDHLQGWVTSPGYSLAGILFGPLYKNLGALGVAVTVSLFQLASILILERGIQQFAPSVSKENTRL